MKLINFSSFAILTLILSLTSATQSQNFWQTTDNISGGKITSIEKISSNILIAGSYRGGLFRSTNNGDSWYSISNFVDNLSVYAVKKNNVEIIFVGTSRSIYVSTDQGINWTLSNNGLPFYSYAQDFAFDDSGNVYTAFSSKGIYKSSDNGNSWFEINYGLSSPMYIRKIEFTANKQLIASDYYNGIFRSTDYGASWSSSNNGYNPAYPAEALNSNSSGEIFMATWGEGAYRSTDDGNSWHLINGDLTGTLYFSDIAVNNSGSLFITSFNTLNNSTNSGTNWTQILSEPYSGIFHCILIDVAGNLWIGAEHGGIYKSTDWGGSWTNYTNGLSSTVIGSLLADNLGDLFTAAYGKGVYRSTDNGTNWMKMNILNADYDNSIVCIDLIPTGGLIAFATFGGIFKTNDLINWIPFGTGLPGYSTTVLCATNDYFFAGTNDGKIYRSPSTTANWVDITDTLSTSFIHKIGVKSNGDVYLLSDLGIYKSTNNGSSWLNLNNGIPVTYYFSLAFHPNGDVIVGGSGVYRSIDGGNSWTTSSTGLGNSGGLSLAIHPNGSIFVGTYNSVYRSNDLGNTWSYPGMGMDNVKITSLAFGQSDILFSGTDGWGIYKSLVPVTSINNNETGLVRNFQLNQNYPNPFNPVTKISWQTPQAGLQTLRIFDLLGNEVATLFDEFKPAGSYEVDFDGSGLSSGLYIYILNSGNYFSSRKMILLK